MKMFAITKVDLSEGLPHIPVLVLLTESKSVAENKLLHEKEAIVGFGVEFSLDDYSPIFESREKRVQFHIQEVDIKLDTYFFPV